MKPIVFSLGYRCSSAGILKHLGIKSESYPFDWLISRLPIIKDCIENDFQHFLNKDNYQKCETKTNHYFHLNNTSKNNSILICNESIVYNNYYQTKFTKDELVIPYSLHFPHDTYSFHLALNHRDILCEEDHEYFKRCIDRFKKMIKINDNKISLYIHPVLSLFEFENNKTNLFNQFIEFHTYISSITKNLRGLYVIIVKKNNYMNSFIEKIEMKKKDCEIFILYTNENFIDAGEIFMQQNHELETHLLIELVKSFIII
jgi:hypothetical protein